MHCNSLSFFELLRAGLWEKDVELWEYGTTDFAEIMQLAEEQSVVGLVTAGLERVVDVKVPQDWTFQFIGSTLQMEQRNKGMNAFIDKLIGELRQHGVYALIVKGQGIAQCYERPLWRACGDVDLLLSADNYSAAKEILITLASSVEEEDKKRKHLGLVIDGWVVELHGTLHTRQLPKVNKVVDEAQIAVFNEGKVRPWMIGRTQVFLPAPDEDVVFVFSHIIQHFFGGGIGLRQICDWCRLLWTYRAALDCELLEKRIKKMRMMTEWKAFAALAVNYLGIPVDAMPLYDSRFTGKGSKVLDYVLKYGNFGHNRDNSYRNSQSFIVRSIGSLLRYTKDTFNYIAIFPIDSLKVWCRMVARGLKGE